METDKDNKILTEVQYNMKRIFDEETSNHNIF